MHVYLKTNKDQLTANDLPLSPKLMKIYNVSDNGELHMESFLVREYKKFISLTEPYLHPWNHTEGEGAHMVGTPCICLIHSIYVFIHMFEISMHMLSTISYFLPNLGECIW